MGDHSASHRYEAGKVFAFDQISGSDNRYRVTGKISLWTLGRESPLQLFPCDDPSVRWRGVREERGIRCKEKRE
jgi:hypothetical protein